MYVVVFPADAQTIITLKQSLRSLEQDFIMMRYIDQIRNLRIGESLVIRSRYFVVCVG